MGKTSTPDLRAQMLAEFEKGPKKCIVARLIEGPGGDVIAEFVNDAEMYPAQRLAAALDKMGFSASPTAIRMHRNANCPCTR